jgi:hypothetical protein
MAKGCSVEPPCHAGRQVDLEDLAAGLDGDRPRTGVVVADLNAAADGALVEARVVDVAGVADDAWRGAGRRNLPEGAFVRGQEDVALPDDDPVPGIERDFAGAEALVHGDPAGLVVPVEDAEQRAAVAEVDAPGVGHGTITGIEGVAAMPAGGKSAIASASRSSGSFGRSSLATTIPPLKAMPVARKRVSGRLREVSVSRTMRQSGSLTHHLLCIQLRCRVRRIACFTDGFGPAAQTSLTSGPTRIASTRPMAGPKWQVQPRMNVSSPAASRMISRPRRRFAGAVVPGAW